MTRSFIALLSAVTVTVAGLTSCQSTSPGSKRFDQADANHDGRLSTEETTDYLVAEVFATRDANHDGQMTPAEWNPSMDAAGRRRFNQRDTNHDGQVSLQEATAYAIKTGACEAMIKEADANKDGFVSHAEAVAYMASKEGPMR